MTPSGKKQFNFKIHIAHENRGDRRGNGFTPIMQIAIIFRLRNMHFVRLLSQVQMYNKYVEYARNQAMLYS